MKIILCKDNRNRYYVQYDPKEVDAYGFVSIKRNATMFETKDIENVMMRLRYYWHHIDNWKIENVWFRIKAKE
jgi:hypothetical protein